MGEKNLFFLGRTIGQRERRLTRLSFFFSQKGDNAEKTATFRLRSMRRLSTTLNAAPFDYAQCGAFRLRSMRRLSTTLNAAPFDYAQGGAFRLHFDYRFPRLSLGTSGTSGISRAAARAFSFQKKEAKKQKKKT